MKISIITAVYNRADTIADAIRSVQSQTYLDVEHIIIDGASQDGTLHVIDKFKNERTRVVSEPDNGIYDAINKGLRASSGEVIGLMHSDDLFAGIHVLEKVAKYFQNPEIDMVYGDLQYVARLDISRIIRFWRAGPFYPDELRRGWMPPHPTLYVRRGVIEKLGVYDTSFRIAADYEAILRWFGHGSLRSFYVPEVFVKMRVGGESNRSAAQIIAKSREDYRAIRRHRLGGLSTLLMKNVRKLNQFEHW